MTKTFLKKYWIILISASCVSTGVVLACADEWDDYGVSNFTPEAFVDSAYSPFFYSDQFYYGIGHDEAHISRFNNSNAAEWSAWLGGKAGIRELGILLDSTGAATIDSAATWFYQRGAATQSMQTATPQSMQAATPQSMQTAPAQSMRATTPQSMRTAPRPASLQSMQLLADRDDRKAAAFFRYLRLAKQCEAFSVTPIPSFWEERPKTAPAPVDTLLLNRRLREGLASAPDAFLKERYWFQLVRSAFFNGTPRETIRLFQAYAGGFTPDRTWYRSMAYMAGAYYKLKDYSHADYYYSRVFDGCNELKTVAHYSFHPQEEKDWRATLALCAGNSEKATLWQMLGIFYSDPQRAIREIYALDPGSEKLEVLLSRAVNESEQRFGSGRINSASASSGSASISSDGAPVSSDSAPASSDSSDKALLALVSRIANAGNTAKPWIWQLAAGYLDMLDARYTAAGDRYGKAEKIVPRAPLPQAQYRLLKLLNMVSAVKAITPALERALTPDLTWLLDMEVHPVDPSFRYTGALSWLKRTMADRYRAAGDLVRSECFVSTSAFYADDRNTEALKAFLGKPGKTPYDVLCARLSVNKEADLFEYQAVQRCMSDRIQEAISAMREVPSADTTILPGNPFNARIQDCHDCDHDAPQKIRYSKLAFLQKLKDLRDKITAGQDVYTNAVLLGNAQYNITQYGNARAFYECSVLGTGHAEPWSIDSVFRMSLTSMQTAVKYYTLALGAARNDEQKAKCQYLLAKCQRNEWYNRTYYNDPKNEYGGDGHRPDFIAWEGFKALKQYSGTQYYKDVIRECGYFRAYIRAGSQPKTIHP